MKEISEYRIKIYTRSVNCILYKYSQKLISYDICRQRLLNTTADGYLLELLKDETCDIIINIDEDAFLINETYLEDLVKYVIDNKYINCGMPDGGMVDIRDYNPIITNPYFNIFNLKLIRQLFNYDDYNRFSYEINKRKMEELFPTEILTYNGNFNCLDYEPYYKFFFYLASLPYKTLYLTASVHPDGYTTILNDHKQRPFLLHTWYSRFYKKDAFHTKRINSIIKEAYKIKGEIMSLSIKDKIEIYNENLSLVILKYVKYIRKRFINMLRKLL